MQIDIVNIEGKKVGALELADAVFGEDLRHSDFSTNDSANHIFSILDFGFAILDLLISLSANPKSKI